MKKILKLAAVGVSAFMLCSYIGQNNYVQPSAVEQTDIDDAEKEQQQVQNKIDNLQKELDSSLIQSLQVIHHSLWNARAK